MQRGEGAQSAGHKAWEAHHTWDICDQSPRCDVSPLTFGEVLLAAITNPVLCTNRRPAAPRSHGEGGEGRGEEKRGGRGPSECAEGCGISGKQKQ